MSDARVIDVPSDLSLTFQTDRRAGQALSDINLTSAGEFVSLIGPSGCGKTTLLRVIADLERPTAGTILVNGMTPDEARERAAYGYVFQAPALYPVAHDRAGTWRCRSKSWACRRPSATSASSATSRWSI